MGNQTTLQNSKDESENNVFDECDDYMTMQEKLWHAIEGKASVTVIEELLQRKDV